MVGYDQKEKSQAESEKLSICIMLIVSLPFFLFFFNRVLSISGVHLC